MDTQQPIAGSASGTFTATEPSKATIKKQSIRLLSSGLMGQMASKEPLVSLHKSGDFQDCFDVLIHMYLPDHARNLHLSENISSCGVIDIENGPIEVREVNIIYDNPAGHPEIYAYSLWEIRFRYCVEGRQVPAIRVRYVIGDPETTNGTVTSVEKT